MRIECQLSRLEAALSNIQKMHPYRGESVSRIGETLIDNVRRQLEETSFDDMEELAYRFGIREILACVEIVVSERIEETARKAAEILRYRPKKRVLFRVWSKLVFLYPNYLLEETMRDMITKKGFQGLNEMPDVSPAVMNWIIPQRLDEGVLRDHQTNSGQKSLDPYLEENHISLDDGLHRAVWRVLLKKGSPKLISRETPKRLMEVFEDPRNAADSQEFGQHYLNVLQKRPNWATPVLEWIEKRFGSSKFVREENERIETPFWRQVDIGPKKEFALWIMEQRIEQFFEGERADFWKRFLQAGKVIRVQEILQGDGFMIDFDRFGVIEFKQVGNAAYVYSQSVFNDYWRRSQRYYHPSEFKDTDRTIRDASLASWDGRILHPRNSWQESAAHKIHHLLRNK